MSHCDSKLHTQSIKSIKIELALNSSDRFQIFFIIQPQKINEFAYHLKMSYQYLSFFQRVLNSQ